LFATLARSQILKTCFMRTISYAFQSGDAVQKADFAFPPTSNKDFPSCGVFAFAKSGSVLVNAIVRDLMAAASVPVIDWPAVWYWQGVDTGSFQADLSEVFPARGYCFAGFREIPRSFLGAPAIRRLRKIIVVRDPRDMLVSRYFSTKYSHGFEPRGTAQVAQLMRQLIDDGQTDLDSYCLHYSWIVNADFLHASRHHSRPANKSLPLRGFSLRQAQFDRWDMLLVRSSSLTRTVKRHRYRARVHSGRRKT
jgi:hypothetical protein